MPNLKNEIVDQFKAGLRGPLLRPDEAGYDQARSIWNAMIDRRPALIVRCAGVADVMRAVAFARDNDVRLAVRGGGHNIAGNAVCDGGLMLDMSPMRSAWIDVHARHAFVEAGATLADFDHEAQAFGLATPLGINSTTGVAGLTLGGGFGWLSRKYGLTVDNLIAAEIVTADGERRWTSAEQEPDLFWAIRGGGGNFGVVTLFEFQLHAVGPEIFGGLIVFPHEQAKSVLSQYRDFVGRLPQDLSVWAVLRQAPPLPFLPPEVHGKDVVVLAAFYCGKTADGAAAVEPLRGFGQPYGEHLGPMPYTAWQQAFDPLLTPGARNYWKSHNFSALERRRDRHRDPLRRPVAVAAVRNLPRPDRRRGQPAGSGRHRLPAPRRAVRDERPHALERSGRRPQVHRLGARLLRRRRAVRQRQRLCQFPDPGRGRTDRRGVRTELRAPGAGEEQVRPAQPVPAEPEHRADRVADQPIATCPAG